MGGGGDACDEWGDSGVAGLGSERRRGNAGEWREGEVKEDERQVAK